MDLFTIVFLCAAPGVNIREQPNTYCKILGQTLLNTEFEVVLDIGGWSMITTEDGYAYIKSEFLNDDEVKYTTEDLYVMAHVIAGEAQLCDDAEQKYVGSVVLNRVAHSEYPDTIKGVVCKKTKASNPCGTRNLRLHHRADNGNRTRLLSLGS
ncbi:MAG: SH3 domain-containing protein [Lacrimispora sphenoides]